VFDNDELKLVTVTVNEPDNSLTEDEIDDDTVFVNPLNPGITDMSNVIDPDRTPSAFILSFIVVLIELVNEFNDPVLVSTEEFYLPRRVRTHRSLRYRRLLSPRLIAPLELQAALCWETLLVKEK
jgi:hypothetical protein